MSIYHLLRSIYPGKPSWSPDHLPDLSSKVILVTGGNTGIGREIVKRSLMKNAKVYLAARSQQKAERAIQELREETGKEALFLQLDLSDLNAVKKAAEEFKQRESQLDVLYLNAGVMMPPRDQLTAQGYDATFGTNVVGHYLFLRLLYPLLSASGKSSDPSRLVWLASVGHYGPRKLAYEAYVDGPARKKVDLFDIYGQSKLAAVMLSMYFANKEGKESKVISIAADPGNIRSEIFRGDIPWYMRIWEALVLYPVEYGGLTPLYAGGAPEAATYNGKYLEPWARVGKPSSVAVNVQEQERLRDWLDEQVKSYL
ncbi:NAD-P-binding protein [Cubamyces sp. BRFM 1775]|nr:NAD-P-binding protein [Cubamyces sp. BRFM 1775]